MSRARLVGTLAFAVIPIITSCDDDPTDPERTPPTVTATTPAAGATGISRNTTVTATFSEPILSASVTAGTFTVTPAGGVAVEGAVALSGNTATFTPSSPLALGTTYTARVSADAADTAGNRMAQPHIWTFTTTTTLSATADESR